MFGVDAPGVRMWFRCAGKCVPEKKVNAMKEMHTTYNPKEFEDKIYAQWTERGSFRAEIDPQKVPFTVMMPPPNITGQLHMGHAMDETMQDILIRFKRMQGYCALWLPGTDHASIATEVKIVEQMKREGLTKQSLGREEFLRRAWAWKEQYGGRIVEQLKKLGSSCDWSRLAFTMDERCSSAVREAFFRLYQKGLVYRGDRIINWCPGCKTALSDAEVEYAEEAGHFWHFSYPLEEGGRIVVATTRPETMLGDTAVAVHPSDERYAAYIGKYVRLPLTDRRIPVVADEYVDPAFGTGAVKITPAHDPNDFEVGLRHALPVIRVMNDDGTMNERAGAYAGLDRYEARRRVIADMQALGLLVKTEPHAHNVGHCYRCHSTVEPIVSKQWFVRMKPLAKPAIDAVVKNKTKFTPDRFAKIYYNWLENIRDWCISRQLWWGHRIPVWYCDDCGEVICTREGEPAVCPKCGGTHLKQDEDVLDTWFSSALWPFSTLGWPRETDDFSYFYPTDVLVTGYDIIPFWVMRMMFSGIEYTQKVPFRDVLIHGLVRDEQGRKMSKSLGNGIDPLEIIDRYGADSLRLALVTGVAPGNDTRFTDAKVEASRNFINKLWNAARFVLLNVKDDAVPALSAIKLQPADRWIISRLQTCIRECVLSLQKYDLGIAADKLIDFTWNDFCDWYIELSKPSLYGGDDEKRRGALAVLVFVLDNVLRLLHPFIPFVTEEIYSYLPGEHGMIISAEYPRYNSKLAYKKEAGAFEGIIDLIKTVRAMKVEVNCPPSKKVHLYLVTDSRRLIGANRGSVLRLAGASEIDFVDSGAAAGDKAMSRVCEPGQIFIPLGELIDIEEERARLQKELERIDGEIARASGKLSNHNFVAKAPKKLVDDERAKLEKYIDMKTKTQQRLAAL